MAGPARAVAVRTAGRLWWLPLVPLGALTERGTRWRWILLPGVVIATALASSAAKLAIRRPRPGCGLGRARRGRLGAAGFPSTHAACAFAIAGWLRASRHRQRLRAIAVLIAYSRVRRRAHHPTDVVAGAVLGLAIARQIERTRAAQRPAPSSTGSSPAALRRLIAQAKAPPVKSMKVAYTAAGIATSSERVAPTAIASAEL
ncbi:MAG: hypothetical protein QOE75_410 [Solirubrobacterales bacterium]|nr:hypothetical protein [Solirubrobacterales bacterium]